MHETAIVLPGWEIEIPPGVMENLNLKPGDRVVFYTDANGAVIFRKAKSKQASS